MFKSIPTGCLALLVLFPYPVLCDDNKTVETSVSVHRDIQKWEEPLEKLQSRFDLESNDIAVLISLSDQELRVVKSDKTLRVYKVSTSKYGPGNKAGSHKTPLGTHCIAQKIGLGAKFGTIFTARLNTGKTAKIYRDRQDSRTDQKTTRILWLKGMERGINKGNGVDTFNRCIYIHGTPEEGLIGTPASNGCIRMRNGDVIELFDLVHEGTLIEIYN